MSIVARGRVKDRPFARTVYAVGVKRFAGDMVMTEHGRRYVISWKLGLVVAAKSASPADSVARVALNAGWVSTTQLSDIMRELSSRPDVEPIDVIARMARLDDTRKYALARRAMAQRAMRMFALPEATFELSTESELTPHPKVAPVGVRTLICRGLNAHYSEERLFEEMSEFVGQAFKLSAIDEAAQQRLKEYGFSKVGAACVRLMSRKPRTIGVLSQRIPEASRKEILATVYALLAAGDAVGEAAPESHDPTPRASTQSDKRPSPEQRQTGRRKSGSHTKPRLPPTPVTRTKSSRLPTRAKVKPRQDEFGEIDDDLDNDLEKDADNPQASQSRTIKLDQSAVQRARRAARAPTQNNEIRALIADKLELLDSGCTHYALLGVASDAKAATIRKAYFGLARKLHPDRLRAIGVSDGRDDAQRLFATINKAFSTLADKSEREEYDATLKQGGTGDEARDQDAAEQEAVRLITAEEHFLRGEQAIRSNRMEAALVEFESAVDMNPDEPDHHAMLAWALWCCAEDKDAVMNDVRKSLNKAIKMAPKCVAAYFNRGRIAAARGDQKNALADFQKVLSLRPSHREADLQVRLLQSRISKGKNKSGSFLARRKRQP